MSAGIYPSSSHYQHIMDQFLKTKLTVSAHLENLVMLLSSRIKRDTIYAALENISDLMHIFKYGILLQRTTISGCVPDSSILLEAIQNKLRMINSWKGMGEDGAKFLKEKILTPYLGYLEKRLYDGFHHENVTYQDKTSAKWTGRQRLEVEEKQNLVCTQAQKTMSKPTLRNSNIKVTTNSSPEAGEPTTDKMQKYVQECFYLINLLNKAISFCPSMLSLIRYFGGYLGCILDFNITMAMDLGEVYQRLISTAKQIQHYLLQSQVRILYTSADDKNEKQNLIKQVEILFNELEKVNDGLYLIYFNCYYGNHTKRYAPTFINTQNTLKSIEKLLTRLNKQRRVYEIMQIIHNKSEFEQKSVSIIRSLAKPKMVKSSQEYHASLQEKTLSKSQFEGKRPNRQLTSFTNYRNKVSVLYGVSGVRVCNEQKVLEEKSSIKDFDESTGFQLVQSEDESIEQYQEDLEQTKDNNIDSNIALLIEMSILVENLEKSLCEPGR